MSDPGIKIAVKLADGSPSALARLIGRRIRRQHVEHWLKTGRVPVEHCAPIERALDKRVRRWELRPDDWHIHWPELVDAPGAPQPQAQLALEGADA